MRPLHSNGVAYDANADFFFATSTTDRTSSSRQRFCVQFTPQIFNSKYIMMEVMITHCPVQIPMFGIGFAPKAYNDGMCGWSNYSIGYHSDDGMIFSSQQNNSRVMDKAFFSTYSLYDVVGVGWDTETGTIFFTKNGFKFGQTFVRNPSASMVPTITFGHASLKFKVNAGYDLQTKPFKYQDLLPPTPSSYSIMPSAPPSSQLSPPPAAASAAVVISSPSAPLVASQPPPSASPSYSESLSQLKQALTQVQQLANAVEQDFQKAANGACSVKHRVQITSSDIARLQPPEIEEVELEMKKSLKLLQDVREKPDCCSICFDQKRTVVFLPCKHCVTCTACSQMVQTCPLCRETIIEKMKIFL